MLISNLNCLWNLRTLFICSTLVQSFCSSSTHSWTVCVEWEHRSTLVSISRFKKWTCLIMKKCIHKSQVLVGYRTAIELKASLRPKSESSRTHNDEETEGSTRHFKYCLNIAKHTCLNILPMWRNTRSSLKGNEIGK